MGDLLTEVLAFNASSNAAEAAKQAEKAEKAGRASEAVQNASEERLEASGNNPFITFNDFNLEEVEENVHTFLGIQISSDVKEKVSAESKKVSVKKTDISFLKEQKDDFGTVYTAVYLEERCDLEANYLVIVDTIENVQNHINNQ